MPLSGDPAIKPSSIAQGQALLAAIIASSDDAIVSKDLNGVVQSWNAAAERMFGYTAGEMVGQPITRLIPPDRQEEEPRILQRLRGGERVDHFETVRVRKDGRRIQVSVTISPVLDETGRVIGASKIARDITVQKQLEEERDRLLESESSARADAERSSLLKDEFLATLSHELRTPLNAIYGWAQLLQRRSVTDSEITEGLAVIARNARVQTQLIEDLLDMSRIISGKLRLDIRPIELAGVVESAIQSVLPAAQAKEIRFSRSIEPDLGKFNGDPGRLQQVIWNLLSNAVKFTPPLGRIDITIRRSGPGIQIAVADTGQGIAAEFLPHLFERFRQADASTTRRHGGLGLGLSIAKHLVELHGGTMAAESPGPDRGTTIFVNLPLRAARREVEESDPAPPTEEESASGNDRTRLAGLSVLVVDDEPDSRELLRCILHAAGAKVASAGSSSEAMALLRDVPHDVVLSDIGMPGEDGYSFIKRLRALADVSISKVPAIALTAYARGDDRRRALLAGYEMHLAKPVEPAELVAVVASVAGRT